MGAPRLDPLSMVIQRWQGGDPFKDVTGEIDQT
jgi:hypothetical protein